MGDIGALIYGYCSLRDDSLYTYTWEVKIKRPMATEIEARAKVEKEENERRNKTANVESLTNTVCVPCCW